MSYTPLSGDRKEYLDQIARHRDAMVNAITSDQGTRVPQEILDLAVARVNDAFKSVEFWLRFRTPADKLKPIPHADREA